MVNSTHGRVEYSTAPRAKATPRPSDFQVEGWTWRSLSSLRVQATFQPPLFSCNFRICAEKFPLISIPFRLIPDKKIIFFGDLYGQCY
jgi:hypothetical protein